MAERVKVIIVGSGPSGYTAGIYLSRARLEPLLFAGRQIGGQLINTTVVENYPGFPQGINGPDLMVAMRQQAERFGTKIIDDVVSKIEKIEGGFRVWKGEESWETQTILLSTGARSRPLSLPRETELTGRGVSYCAVCDAAFFRDKNVYVVGGGDSAMEDTLALTKHAATIHVVHRRGEFRASKIMQDRVLNHPKVKVHWNTSVVELRGEQTLTSLVLENVETKQREEVAADGLFVAIGHSPSTEFLKDLVALDQEGYILTRLALEKPSLDLAAQHLDDRAWVDFPTMTSVDGIFAAGDCVDFRYRQAATAAGFGTMAALDIERWLDEH